MRLKKEEKKQGKKGKGGKIGNNLQNPRLLGDAVHVFISMSRERNVRKVGRVDVGVARDKTRIGGHSWYDVDAFPLHDLYYMGKEPSFHLSLLSSVAPPHESRGLLSCLSLEKKMKTMGLEKIYAHPPSPSPVKCNLPRCETKPTKPSKRDHPPTMNKRNICVSSILFQIQLFILHLENFSIKN